MSSIGLAIISLLTIQSISGHIEVQSPPPRSSKFHKIPGSRKNYNLMAPVERFGCSQFTKFPSAGTYQAGQNVIFAFAGTAKHNGGSCQFYLSYDGETFVALNKIIGICLIGSEPHTTQILTTASNGPAAADWFWINHTGNREFYMNCISITIQGGSGAGVTGPQVSVANLPGYPTIPEGPTGIPAAEEFYKKAKTVTIGGGGGAVKLSLTSEASEIAPSQQSGQAALPITQAPSTIPSNGLRIRRSYH